MDLFKRQLPIFIAFVVGLVLWAVYYIPSTLAQNVQQSFTAWAIILSGAALILGILSAIQHHWSKVSLLKPGYGYSLITLFCFGFVMLAGWFSNEHWNWPLIASCAFFGIGAIMAFALLFRHLRGIRLTIDGNTIAAAFFIILGLVGVFGIVPLQAKLFTGLTIKERSLFDWIFQNMFVPLDATMFSLLAFYIASAAFRAFRARSFEATALLIAGCIVMIGRVPLGEQLTTSGLNTTAAVLILILVALGIVMIVKQRAAAGAAYLLGAVIVLVLALTLGPRLIAVAPEFAGHISFSTVAGWILNNPNAAAQRGILLGVLLSMVAISLRIIFGIERTYMGGAD
jgi:hypothetical protein